MSVVAPPPLRRAEIDELDALIKEARERQRRRRIRTTAVFAALAAAAAAAYGVDRTVSGGSHTSAPATGDSAAASSFSGHGLLAYISRGSLLVLNGNTGSQVLVAPRREDRVRRSFRRTAAGSASISAGVAPGSRAPMAQQSASRRAPRSGSQTATFCSAIRSSALHRGDG
jgi:hypothetical protein